MRNQSKSNNTTLNIAVDKNDYAINLKPSYTIQMHNDNGIIGTLDFNDSVLKFEGNADESSEVFINAICENWTKRLEQERISAAKWCIDIIENCDGDLDYAIFDIKREFGIEK